jgi:hypothetical protein
VGCCDYCNACTFHNITFLHMPKGNGTPMLKQYKFPSTL